MNLNGQKNLSSRYNLCVDVLKLKQTTQRAEACKKQAADAQNPDRQSDAESIASNILAQVNIECFEAAREGQSQVAIMQIEYGRDCACITCMYSSCLSPDRLTGPALIVWESLVQAGLNPTIEHYSSPWASDIRFDIVAHW